MSKSQPPMTPMNADKNPSIEDLLKFLDMDIELAKGIDANNADLVPLQALRNLCMAQVKGEVTNPTELDKAIERCEISWSPGSLPILLAAAKRVKELEEVVKCSGIKQEHLTFTLQLLNRAEQAEDKLRMCQESKDYLQSKLAAAERERDELKADDLKQTELLDSMETLAKAYEQQSAAVQKIVEALKSIFNHHQDLDDEPHKLLCEALSTLAAQKNPEDAETH